jgi:hypothetical protein
MTAIKVNLYGSGQINVYFYTRTRISPVTPVKTEISRFQEGTEGNGNSLLGPEVPKGNLIIRKRGSPNL